MTITSLLDLSSNATQVQYTVSYPYAGSSQLNVVNIGALKLSYVGPVQSRGGVYYGI